MGIENFFHVDFVEYNVMAYEFFTHLHTITNRDKIEAGIKCLGIAYVALIGTDYEKYRASEILTIMSDEAANRLVELEFSGK